MVKKTKSRINTLGTCPYLYKLQYIDHRLPEYPNSVLGKIGTEVHKIFEQFFENIDIENIPDIPYQYFINVLDVPLHYRNVYNVFCETEAKRYIGLEDKSTFMPIFREKYIINGDESGIIDRVDYYKNEYLVFDYKSSTSNPSKLRFELNFYKKLLDESGILDRPVKYIGAYGYRTGTTFIEEVKTRSYNSMLRKVEAFESLDFKNLHYEKKYGFPCKTWCPYRRSCRI